MTRNLADVVHCVCGDAPHCPFHSTVIRGETRLDRICREAREHVARRFASRDLGRPDVAGDARRNRYRRAVIVEIDRRLALAGIPNEVGLATPESIAASKTSWRKYQPQPAPSKRRRTA